MIRLGILEELDGIDRVPSLQQRLADAVHAVHHAPVARENDGMLQIALLDQTRMIHKLPAGHLLTRRPAPIRLIEFANLSQKHPADWKRP